MVLPLAMPPGFLPSNMLRKFSTCAMFFSNWGMVERACSYSALIMFTSMDEENPSLNRSSKIRKDSL